MYVPLDDGTFKAYQLTTLLYGPINKYPAYFGDMHLPVGHWCNRYSSYFGEHLPFRTAQLVALSLGLYLVDVAGLRPAKGKKMSDIRVYLECPHVDIWSPVTWNGFNRIPEIGKVTPIRPAPAKCIGFTLHGDTLFCALSYKGMVYQMQFMSDIMGSIVGPMEPWQSIGYVIAHGHVCCVIPADDESRDGAPYVIRLCEDITGVPAASREQIGTIFDPNIMQNCKLLSDGTIVPPEPSVLVPAQLVRSGAVRHLNLLKTVVPDAPVDADESDGDVVEGGSVSAADVVESSGGVAGGGSAGAADVDPADDDGDGDGDGDSDGDGDGDSDGDNGSVSVHSDGDNGSVSVHSDEPL
jgi:hypothetical protein